MADLDALEKDLRVEVRKLPSRLIMFLQALAQEFGPQLEALFGPMFDKLKPHVSTLIFEASMGLFDDSMKRELNEIVMRVLREEQGVKSA